MGKKNDHLRYNQSHVSILLLFGEKQLYFYYTALVGSTQSWPYQMTMQVEIPYQAIVSG